MTKTLNNLVFLSKDNDWFWDNDENGMTYFIYDREHNLHDTPEEKRYQIIMTPQSEIGNILKINLIPENSACVLESDDCECMNSWANNMSDGLFPSTPVPEFIIQNEALNQFFRAACSPHMTESDTDYLFKKAISAYHISESDINDYGMYLALDETEERPANADNVEKFLEGAGNIAANVGAGGAGALVMQLAKSLPGPLQAVAGIGTAIASGVAKYFGTAAAVKKSDEYKDLVAEGKSKEAAKLVTSKAGKSAAQAVAAAGAGALASKFLPGLINKMMQKKAIAGNPEELAKAADGVTTADVDKSFKDFNDGKVVDNWQKLDPKTGKLPVTSEAPAEIDFSKMAAKDIDPSKFGAEEYQKFLTANPQYQGAKGLQQLMKDNPALGQDFTDLQSSGAFKGMSYNDIGQVRNTIKQSGGDTSLIQKYINDASGLNGNEAMTATGSNFTQDWANDPTNPVQRAKAAAAAKVQAAPAHEVVASPTKAASYKVHDGVDIASNPHSTIVDNWQKLDPKTGKLPAAPEAPATPAAPAVDPNAIDATYKPRTAADYSTKAIQGIQSSFNAEAAKIEANRDKQISDAWNAANRILKNNNASAAAKAAAVAQYEQAEKAANEYYSGAMSSLKSAFTSPQS